MISQRAKLSNRLSSKEWRNYKRTQQGALTALLLYVMRHSGHGQFLFSFLLFSNFIGILFFFSFLFRDDEEAHDIAVT